MINPNDIRKLSEILTETLNRVIPEQTVEKLSEKQRNFLAVLIHLYQVNEPTRDGKHPLVVMKDMLGIKNYLDKKETYLKLKNI